MKYLENIIDTRKMEVAVLETKRAQMIEHLGEATDEVSGKYNRYPQNGSCCIGDKAGSDD
jgi:hypothetical protein